MIFAAEIGLVRIHSHGNVKAKLPKQGDSRSEFTPYFPTFSPNECSSRTSDSRRLDTFMQRTHQKIFGCSNSIGSCESENDPLAKCLAEIEDLENESMESLEQPSVPTKKMTAQDFQVVNVAGLSQLKPSLLEACLEAIED